MAKSPYDRGHADGASSSINATIKDIEDFLTGAQLSPAPPPMREELRRKISGLCLKWYKRGFNRGCMQSHADTKSLGRFPSQVSYDATRDFFSGKKRKVTLTWKAKKKRRKP